jgi:hypothetical protein
MLWVVGEKILERVVAWGGEGPASGVVYDVMKPRATTPGRYVIHSYEAYRTNTWPWSKISWGTRLKVDAVAGEVLFEAGGSGRPWTKVRERIPGISTRDIRDAYWALYGGSRKYDADGDQVPEIWVFNDFGPKAVRYFRDLDHNRRLDANERLSGEMIHTTPDNEAEAALGDPVVLGPSHGCIHVDPFDRDRLHRAGAFNRGTDLFIHGYDAKVPVDLR